MFDRNLFVVFVKLCCHLLIRSLKRIWWGGWLIIEPTWLTLSIMRVRRNVHCEIFIRTIIIIVFNDLIQFRSTVIFHKRIWACMLLVWLLRVYAFFWLLMLQVHWGKGSDALACGHQVLVIWEVNVWFWMRWGSRSYRFGNSSRLLIVSIDNLYFFNRTKFHIFVTIHRL
jgi:hypothetical protein